jgi:transcriptional regulator with XRE-family HTH domain
MTINERIKYFRKEIKKMNQKQFAEILGVTQSGVSYMEQEGSTVADSSIKVICSVCGLNEEWLRNGLEPMAVQLETFNLDEFARARGASDLELKVVKAYFELDSDIRKMLIEHFKTELMDDDSSDHPKTPEELEEQYPVEEEGSGLGAG